MLITTPRIYYSNLQVSRDWNFDSFKESKMHRIHSYPAKFPSVIVSKALDYAKEKNIAVKNIADIFCGCGTTALEAKKKELEFIGYDINPVATLIAKVKSENYQIGRLNKYYTDIQINLKKYEVQQPKQLNSERILYWFNPLKIKKLNALLVSINSTVPPGKYRNFFLCGFSNILKPTSKWLTKSIKPQIDPDKRGSNVYQTFNSQVDYMITAVKESPLKSKSKVNINRKNIIDDKLPQEKVNLILTSPPYVTSYEYADLHQLSSLWLGFTDDYRKLRKGSVGSLYHQKISEEQISSLNDTGEKIYNRLFKVDKRKALAVAQYFSDLNKAAKKSYTLLKENGLAFFVIGNTSYKGVKIDNANFLLASLWENNFSDIEVIKRKINLKILTPYRDPKGKFSINPKHRKVYQYEYVIVARKNENEKKN